MNTQEHLQIALTELRETQLKLLTLLRACEAMVEYISQQWEDDWENRPNHLRLGEGAIAIARM